METEYLKYDEIYDEVAEKQHFCSIARIKRDGYTAKANTWKVGQKGSLEVLDYKTLQKAQDVTEYCGVLDEFKKNDTTIDLYPIWIPNTYTLTYDLNGGSFNASTTQLFKYGSENAISSEIPIKTGYVFTGWKWGDVTMQPGDKINKGWGNFTLTAQWEKAPYSVGTVLNIEGSDYIVMSQTADGNYQLISGTSIGRIQYQPNQDINGNYKVGVYETEPANATRGDGKYSNTYEGSYIDNYLENTWYNQLPEEMQKAIQTTNVKQVSYGDFSSNPKWKYIDGQWCYNEGTSDNPKWVDYHKANISENEAGAIPLDCWEKNSEGYNNTPYNLIARHVYLPSVEEVSNIVDLNDAHKIYKFSKGTNDTLEHMWFRDSYNKSSTQVISLDYGYCSMTSQYSRVTSIFRAVRPAFIIDLSKIDYTVTGTVNYK